MRKILFSPFVASLVALVSLAFVPTVAVAYQDPSGHPIADVTMFQTELAVIGSMDELPKTVLTDSMIATDREDSERLRIAGNHSLSMKPTMIAVSPPLFEVGWRTALANKM